MGLFLPHGRCGRGDGAAAALTGATRALTGDDVTDRIALSLGLIIVAATVADIAWNDGSAILFLLMKFADMVEWLAFWR
ncbi:hypothetical protein EYC08_14060 [Tabrizicola sp. WMC-M-20]|nr:hypothetical protein EYC08_14060 [Tabrizicola sp. WMC-M-20]